MLDQLHFVLHASRQSNGAVFEMVVSRQKLIMYMLSVDADAHRGAVAVDFQPQGLDVGDWLGVAPKPQFKFSMKMRWRRRP